MRNLYSVAAVTHPAYPGMVQLWANQCRPDGGKRLFLVPIEEYDTAYNAYYRRPEAERKTGPPLFEIDPERHQERPDDADPYDYLTQTDPGGAK